MDTTLLIFACSALGAAAVLCVVVAIVAFRAGKNLDRVTVVVEAMQKDVHDLKVSAMPIIEKAGVFLDQGHQTFQVLESDLAKLSKGAQNLSGIAEDLRILEQSVVARIRPGLEDAASLISGITRGITTFAKKLTDR
ncbi:MAG: hypothetical protein IPH85_07660 [Ignavibacteria bacterium]|nr:hypothetical protein [Ignavibacteria bacterium]MBP6510759.1 hypothetical protein [Candidatus Kapabacteria bacterium]MBK6418305.1 hypothetical protein [Ignavibacteria bacterium]MBK6761151.1 hypothetical protein [Ignavibacteria bacterium]MBK7185792.1 hypothetical protein [Ignavibacteria bacterium]